MVLCSTVVQETVLHFVEIKMGEKFKEKTYKEFVCPKQM
jgi:hypothetical protein